MSVAHLVSSLWPYEGMPIGYKLDEKDHVRTDYNRGISRMQEGGGLGMV